MKKILYILSGLFLATSFTACEPEFENPIGDQTYTSGTADFSNYVAIGNSLTAGYTNGTLYKSGQENSFPAILAGQMKLAGGGEFTQPYMDDDTKDVGGMVFGGTPILPTKLIINAAAGAPERINETPTMELTNIHPGPYNNMGVPGAKIFHLLAPGYGDLANIPIGKANPYYVRFASSSTASVIGDAASQNPTFFSLWIGANDVLAYATSGGIGVDQNEAGNMDPSTYGPNDITNATVFGGVYTQLVNTLTANGAKGVVATIPDVASIPFFTTIPYDALDPTDPNNQEYLAMIPMLNQHFGMLNQAFVALGVPERSITFAIDEPSPVVIKDESLTDISAQLNTVLQAGGVDAQTAAILSAQYGQCRQATDDDLILLTAKSVIGKVNQDHKDELTGMGVPDTTAKQLSYEGLTYPMEDQWVLIPDEITAVRTATTAYNGTIVAIAADKDLAVADMAATMKKMIRGLVIEDGSVYTADYFNGTNVDNLTFGLDGVHPTNRGYAIIANGFIDAIERKYGAKLPKVIPAHYPTIDILPSN